MPKVRALCSAGITQPRRSYDPVRLPFWPLPSATLRPLPSPMNGSPPITRTTFPTCRAHYPGGSSRCTCRLLPTLIRAFPKWQEGRHPHCHFRGLRRLVWGAFCQGVIALGVSCLRENFTSSSYGRLSWSRILWFDPRREHSSVPTACLCGRRAKRQSRMGAPSAATRRACP